MHIENNVVIFDGNIIFDQWTGFISFNESDNILNNDIYIGFLDDYRGVC